MAQKRTDTVIVNGEPRGLDEEKALSEFLSAMNIKTEEGRGVAVALNEEVIRREEWGRVRVKPGDRVEVVTAQQGG